MPSIAAPTAAVGRLTARPHSFSYRKPATVWKSGPPNPLHPSSTISPVQHHAAQVGVSRSPRQRSASTVAHSAQMPPMPAVDFDEGDELRTVGTLRPLASSAVSLEEEEASKFCGVEGQVYVHQPEATPSTSTAPGLDTGASSVPSEGGGQSSKGKYYIHTFGCQMNAADSERMAGCLEAEGYSNVTDPDAADVLIYNTCSIRDHAEKKVYSYIGRFLVLRAARSPTRITHAAWWFSRETSQAEAPATGPEACSCRLCWAAGWKLRAILN
eukprot:scaffold2162_cov398-Prasinococcus_capsulatus_cf.AAC.16